jgi:DNA-directed RNA polymerase subunit N (RpoN/RPB10)
MANLELLYESKLHEIENNIKLNNEQKDKAKCELIDELLPDRWKKRYCCRTRLISYVDLIKIVI